SITRPVSSFLPASYAHYWVCTWNSLLTGWLGVSQVGLEPCSVRTHWVTTTCFMRLLSIPRLRAYLGATCPLLVIVEREILYAADVHPVGRSRACDKRQAATPV